MEHELLPCPFCGVLPRFLLVTKADKETAYICCHNMDCLMRPHYPITPWQEMSREQAIKAWNTRINP